MTGKMPALQFYTGDWRKDPGVQSLPYYERGIWFEILCLMHESAQRGKLLLNGLPMPEEALSQILGLDKGEVKRVVNLLLERGVASRDQESNAFMCRRMVRDELVRRQNAKSGALGGNPNLKAGKTCVSQPKDNPRDNQGDNRMDNHSHKPDVTPSVAVTSSNNTPLPPEPGDDDFQVLWLQHPDPDGRKSALRSFRASVKSREDLADLARALQNYKASDKVRRGFVQKGATWFRNWRDWLNRTPGDGDAKSAEAPTWMNQ